MGSVRRPNQPMDCEMEPTSELFLGSLDPLDRSHLEWAEPDRAALDADNVDILQKLEEDLRLQNQLVCWDDLWDVMRAADWSCSLPFADDDAGAPSSPPLPASPDVLMQVEGGYDERLLVTSVEGPQELSPSRRLWLEGAFDAYAEESFASDPVTGSLRRVIYQKLRRHMHRKRDDRNQITAELDFSAKLEEHLNKLGLEFYQVGDLDLKKMREIWRTTYRRVDSSLKAALQCRERRRRAAAAAAAMTWAS